MTIDRDPEVFGARPIPDFDIVVLFPLQLDVRPDILRFTLRSIPPFAQAIVEVQLDGPIIRQT